MTKDPYGQFADMMSSAMKGHTRQMASGLGGVLGTVTSSGIKLDDFKHEIRDYMTAEFPGMLQIGAVEGGEEPPETGLRAAYETSALPVSSETPGTGSRATLSLGAGLQPGDRVLVIRVNGGSDIIVLCKVVGTDG